MAETILSAKFDVADVRSGSWIKKEQLLGGDEGRVRCWLSSVS